MAPAPVAAVLGPGAEFIASDGDHGALETRRIPWIGVEEAAGLVCVRLAQQRGGLPALRVLPQHSSKAGARPAGVTGVPPPGTWNPSSRVARASCVRALSLRENLAFWAGVDEVAGPPSQCWEYTETERQPPALLGCPDTQVASLGSCWTLAFRLGMAFL